MNLLASRERTFERVVLDVAFGSKAGQHHAPKAALRAARIRGKADLAVPIAITKNH